MPRQVASIVIGGKVGAVDRPMKDATHSSTPDMCQQPRVGAAAGDRSLRAASPVESA